MPKPKASSRSRRGPARSKRKPGGAARGVVRNPAAVSGRYTPPIPREFKESPKIIPYLMFGLLGLGMLIIVVNYMDVLPGGANNWYLLGGLMLITAGFIVATKYR
ncbi:MAG: cell division protein CrgA [Actinobacteria bacterium]|nr:cell division protein CrgA [Actinomycetota bacterium]